MIAATSATPITLFMGASNFRFEMEVDITCTLAGATGTVLVDGGVMYYAAPGANVPITDTLSTGITTASLNTTTSMTLGMTVKWDMSSMSRSITSTICVVEALS